MGTGLAQRLLPAGRRLLAGDQLDLQPFDAKWRQALDLVLRTLRTEQRSVPTRPIAFNRPHGDPTDVVPMAGEGVDPS